MSRWSRNRLAPVAATVAFFATAAVGAFLGSYTPHWTGSALNAARAEATSLGEQVAGNEARLHDLLERNETLQERLIESEQTVARLQQTLGESGELADRYSKIVAEHGALQVAYQSLEAETHSFARIHTPELPSDVLLFDHSVPGVTFTSAVCSGSMEPNISCNDLLILYEPSVSDLREGDVIYFRRQNADCTGPLEDRYMLHRIKRVSAGTEGLRFQTQGDALAGPDRCLVPPGDVLYKLVANIRDARMQR